MNRRKIAIYPGSFNPVHPGHLHVIRQATRVFSKVVVLVAVNVGKHGLEPSQDRCGFIKELVAGWPGVTVAHTEKSLAEYCEESGISFVVRGLRNGRDFESEQTQERFVHEMNLDPELQYMYFNTPHWVRDYSSTAIRELARISDLATFTRLYVDGHPDGYTPPGSAIEKIYKVYGGH